MSKIKVLTVFGTRPEAIKMAPVVKELEKYPDETESIVCVTAQHRQMLDQVLDLFEIKPDFDLNIMKPNQDLWTITSDVLLLMKDVFEILYLCTEIQRHLWQRLCLLFMPESLLDM